MTRPVDPTRAFAFVVGIERYGDDYLPSLPGAAAAAIRFATWAEGCGIPRERIRLACNWLDAQPPCVPGDLVGTAWHEIKGELYKTIAKVGGDLLLIYWFGHGAIERDGRRVLFTSDATKANMENLDVGEMLAFLASTSVTGFDRQVVLIDACANFFHGGPGLATLPAEKLAKQAPRKVAQYVAFAAGRGEKADFDRTKRNAVFSEIAFEWLEAQPALPLDTKAFQAHIEQRFGDIPAGQRSHTPVVSVLQDLDLVREFGGSIPVPWDVFEAMRNVSWPRRIGMVPRLADCFQTRAAVVEFVTTRSVGGTAVLSGLGGVGKSQITAELAENLWQGNQLDLLVWISAISRQAVLVGYAQAAVDVAVPGADGSNTERDAARFHAWLTTTDRRWMVVLDDLESAAHLKGLWPPSRPSGRTVVTTQLRGSSVNATDHHPVQVGEFTAGEATAYLRGRLSDHPDLADDLDGVVVDLGRLPLALSQAAAFLIDEEVPCSEYRQRFANRRQRLDDLVPPPDQLPDDYERTVAATLTLSIEAADRTRPAGLATPLLQLLSVLDPAGIPTSVFTTTAARNWLADARTTSDESGDGGGGEVDLDTVRSGLLCLHRLNLVTVDAAAVTVHGLVQRATREQLGPDQLDAAARTAADALIDIWPDPEPDRAEGQTLRANASALHHNVGDGLLTPDVHPLLLRMGRSLAETGQVTAAVAHFTQLLPDVLGVFGPDHPNTLEIQGNIARWRGRAGDAAGAAAAYEDLLTNRLRVLGPDDFHTLTARHNLAYFRGEAGDLAGALAATEDLLTDVVRLRGPDDPNTLITRFNLAQLRGHSGDLAGAIETLEQLLADRRRVLGPDHADTLRTYQEVAYWRGRGGDPVGAARAFERLLPDVLRVFGPEHPDTLIVRNNLARWRGHAGDPAGAIEAFEQVLADRLRVLGPEHPDTLKTRHELAYWAEPTGD